VPRRAARDFTAGTHTFTQVCTRTRESGSEWGGDEAACEAANADVAKGVRGIVRAISKRLLDGV
jgi:hypothetical protein